MKNKIFHSLALVLILFGAVWLVVTHLKEKAEEVDRLITAAASGDANQVKLLMENGVYVNGEDEEGRTSLRLACEKGYLDVVKVLLDAKANVNIADRSYGWTPLMAADIRL